MAYNTRYKIDSDAWSLEEVRLHLEVVSGLPFVIRTRQVTMDEPLTWYDWREHMQALAMRFPDFTFVVHGTGEQSGDIWRAFFRGSEMVEQQVELKFRDAPRWVPSVLLPSMES